MSAYYNECDPFAAAWLRELIKNGHIADGEVDERSIVDVRPDDLRGFTQCHFFAGIGGWSYALRLAGWPDDEPVWTGSCPCQPFSAIGDKRGIEDERHLWPTFFRLIAEHRPDHVFGEQVASPDGLHWFDGVCADLESEDYAVGAADLCAAGVGAPHIRQRLYWVGQSCRTGLERYTGDGDPVGSEETSRSHTETSLCSPPTTGLDAVSVLRRHDVHLARDARLGMRLPTHRGLGSRSIWGEFDALACEDGWRRVQSGTFPLAHGVSARVGRLRGYGNAIVPQVAAAFVSAYMDTVEGRT